MAWTWTYDITTPTKDDSPAFGDNEIRELKKALVERLGNDHYAELGLGGTQLVSDDVGEHLQVTFNAPLGSDPTVAAGKGILYTKDVSEVAQLHFRNEGTYVKAITSGNGLLNIINADLEAAGVFDGSSIEWHAGGIRVKAEGVTGAMLNDDVVDEDTITLSDSTNKLSILVPTPGTANVANEASIMSTGTYTGNGTTQTVDVGFVIRHLIIKDKTENKGGMEVIKSGSDTNVVWNQKEGNVEVAASSVSLTGNTFLVKKDGAYGDNVNIDTRTYIFQAYGERP